jgi:hypothetical protein
MEITSEIDDSDIDTVVEGWADSNLDGRIEAWFDNHDFADNVDVEGQIRGLLEDFTPGGGGCRTARAFEEAVNGIMEQRGDIVIKQNVDGITGEVRDALAEMVAKEVERQVSVMVVNLQRGLRRLHSLDDAGGPEVAGTI